MWVPVMFYSHYHWEDIAVCFEEKPIEWRNNKHAQGTKAVLMFLSPPNPPYDSWDRNREYRGKWLFWRWQGIWKNNLMQSRTWKQLCCSSWATCRRKKGWWTEFLWSSLPVFTWLLPRPWDKALLLFVLSSAS